MSAEERIARLARQIQGRAREETHLRLSPEEIAGLHRQAASELHAVCAAFAGSVNQRLAEPLLEVSPAQYDAAMFRNPGVNLVQISAETRIIQIAFEAPREPVSREKFLIPYILEGEARAYNHHMLERSDIRTVGLFFCIEPDRRGWRHFDWRTNNSGPFDRQLLVSMMERIF